MTVRIRARVRVRIRARVRVDRPGFAHDRAQLEHLGCVLGRWEPSLDGLGLEVGFGLELGLEVG